MQAASHEPLVYSRQQIAEVLGVSVRTVDSWGKRGIGPPIMKIGHRKLYPRDAVAQWMQRETQSGKPTE